MLLSERIGLGSIFLLCWFGMYFLTNNVQFRKPLIRFRLSLDAKRPFWPRWIYIYLSTYAFALLPIFFVEEENTFGRVVLAYGFITILCHIVFIIYPSSIQRSSVPCGPRFEYRLLFYFQRICRPFGNFPSMHIAYIVLSVYVIGPRANPPLAVAIVAWAILIGLSTLVTWQHYFMDVVAGALLGIVTGLIFFGALH